MSLKAINKKEKDYDNYLWKEVTFAPPKGKLMTRKQIKKFCEEFQSKLPKGTSMVVRAENILRFTQLYSSTSNKWLTDEEYDEYLRKFKIEDPAKFNAFLNFTISIRKCKIDDENENDLEFV